MNLSTVITHDRAVHADEVFATAVLSFINPNIKVIRTRDPILLKNGAACPRTALLDVGGRYDPGTLQFDHHQKEGAGYRNMENQEWPYATAGLVWKHFGKEAIKALHPTIDEDGIAELYSYIDEALMKYIDAVDCGVRLKNAGPTVSTIISSFNTVWYSKKDDEEGVFPLVFELSRVLLTNFIGRYAGKILARDMVRDSKMALDGSILVMNQCCPWVEVVANEMPSVKVVLYPVGGNDSSYQWQLRAAENVDGSLRVQFPKAWGGLDRDSLVKVSRVEGSVFCHRGGYLAGALSLEAALQMAESTIKQGEMLKIAA